MIVLPVGAGYLEIEEASGACAMDKCGVRGGGLVAVQNTTTDPDQIADLAWGGRIVKLCGKHFLLVLTTVVRLAEVEE